MNTINEEDKKAEILIWAYEKLKSLMDKAFAYSDAEVERLRKENEELKQPLTDDERKELERLRNKQADPTYPMTQEQFDRLHLLSNKQWGNAPKELAALKKQVEEMRTFGVKLLRWFESEKDAMRIDATKGYDELVDTYITDKP